MKLPDGYKIIGIIVADNGDDVDGTVLWDDWVINGLDPIEQKDIINDVFGLVDRKRGEIMKKPYKGEI